MPGCVINQSINQFISRHSTQARATVRLCRIKEKCLKTDLKCVNGWRSSTVQWKRVPEFWSSNRETTSSSVILLLLLLLCILKVHYLLHIFVVKMVSEVSFCSLILLFGNWNSISSSNSRRFLSKNFTGCDLTYGDEAKLTS